ncbi:hypothetical protein [Kitasatospora sp. CB01950]|uniref:hypothetical protein n=1 Tax=Kitasatospora sp. CB01950 TaxID=1703930 RepID=UPI000938F9D0|nr:hypothetical protein [Kitasatospora sp. CB01950]OKJ08144.1 hypothetical protein AMK19_19025 [Kitasatospora sp. CB01950]
MSRRFATALAVTALAAATGCASTTAATVGSKPTGPAAVTGAPGPACSVAPSPTETYEGNWKGPLPDEIRCLPHIADGSLSYLASGPTPGGWKALEVHVTPDTDPEQTRALCHRITELGWGYGGSHDITLLLVSGAGHYQSEPGLPACADGSRPRSPAAP